MTDKPQITIAPDGTRRLKLKDITTAKPQVAKDDEVIVTLHEILFGGAITVTGNDDKTLVFRPLNVKAYAAIEAKWGSLENFALLSKTGKARIKDQIALLTILVNQDLPADKEKSEDEVARAIPEGNWEMMNHIIEEMFRPTSLPAQATAQNGSQPDGRVSSTSSPKSSAGRPRQLQH